MELYEDGEGQTRNDQLGHSSHLAITINTTKKTIIGSLCLVWGARKGFLGQ